MGTENFNVNSWLMSGSSGGIHSLKRERTVPPRIPTSQAGACPLPPLEEFCPSHFLIPGWHGEGLISKDSISTINTLRSLASEALTQFNSFESGNKTLKLGVYQEFLSFSHYRGINCDQIEDQPSFWEEFRRDNSPHRQALNEFIKIYCARAVTVYVFKIKFIVSLCEKIHIDINENNLLNPNSFLTKIFKSGSSTELFCESLQSNTYSWFRPNYQSRGKIQNLVTSLQTISTTEMMKICSHILSDQSTRLDYQDEDYSHSLSHRSFGQFLNHLLIKFSQQLLDQKALAPSKTKKDRLPQILNTKFLGDNLTSLSLAHWLAQEDNVGKAWEKLICPDFVGSEFNNGSFVKICHELHFLTFMVKMAAEQGHDPIGLICKSMNEKYTRNQYEVNGQMSMFPKYGLKAEQLYQRIVLNLSKLPKKNPHHYLINQALNEYNCLERHGLLLIFSNQKLFVPSQSEKVEQFLQRYKIEAYFSLEKLKGKGEIPNYLYIFTKKTGKQGQSQFPWADAWSEGINQGKEACLTFRWNGELSQFNKFNLFNNELEKFLQTRSLASTPLYQSEIAHNLSFEFYQDAILDGKLLSSSTENTTEVTHPSFFKNITKHCSPLDTFFGIESIDQENSHKNITSDLLGINFKQHQQFPIILIVNHSDSRNIALEIVPSDSYQAKLEQYGRAFFHYFGLFPKKTGLNINIFREFFNTNIGHQLIQLSLNGGPTKLKGKLKTLLIPNFFGETVPLPVHIENGIDFIKVGTEDIIDMHPTMVRKGYETIKPILMSLCKSYPWYILSLLAHFKFNLQQALSRFDFQKSSKQEINFSNPLVIGPLLELKSNPIYPKNEDVYLEFHIKDKNHIHLPFTECLSKTNEQGEQFLVLMSGKLPLVSLHGDQYLLAFIKFILTSALDLPFSEILSELKIPRTAELRGILKNFVSLEEELNELHGEVDRIITQTIIQQISHS